MRYRESGLRLLLCTSLPRYLLRVIGNLCEPGIDGNRGLDALDRSGLFVSRGKGYAFRGREGKREKLSIAPIKKLPSLSFGPVLYYVQHKVHCSFSLLFPLSLSFSRGQGMPPRRERKFHRSAEETIGIGEKSGCERRGGIKFGGERDGRGRNWRQTERTRRG